MRRQSGAPPAGERQAKRHKPDEHDEEDVQQTADPDILARVQQTYNTFLQRIGRASSQFGDLLVYPPVVVPALARLLTTAYTDFRHAIIGQLRRMYDEQQRNAHRERVAAVLAQSSQVKYELAFLDVSAMTRLFTLTGVTVHESVRVSDVLQHLQGWSVEKEPDPEVRATLAERPDVVEGIRVAATKFAGQWNTLWMSATQSVGADRLRQFASTADVFTEVRTVQWRDLERHPWLIMLGERVYQDLRRAYPWMTGSFFDALLAEGAGRNVAESALDGAVPSALVRDALTSQLVEDVLRRTTAHIVRRARFVLEEDAKRLHDHQTELTTVLGGFATYYQRVCEQAISTRGAGILRTQREQLIALVNALEADPDAWQGFRSDPRHALRTGDGQDSVPTPATDPALYHAVFMACMQLMLNGANERNAPRLDVRNMTVGDRFDQLQLLRYPWGAGLTEFRASYCTPVASPAWADESKRINDTLTHALATARAADWRHEAVAWVSTLLKDSATPAALRTKLQALDDRDYWSLLPRTKGLLESLSTHASGIVHAVCGMSEGGTAASMLEAWRASLLRAGWSPSSHHVWVNDTAPRHIGLSSWFDYTTRLRALTGSLRVTLDALQRVEEATREDGTADRGTRWPTDIRITPDQVGLLMLRHDQGSEPDVAGPSPTVAECALYARRRAGPVDDVLRKHLCVAVLEGLRSDALQRRDPLPSTHLDIHASLTLKQAVDHAWQVVVIEALHTISHDINHTEKLNRRVHHSHRTDSTDGGRRRPEAEARRRAAPAAAATGPAVGGDADGHGERKYGGRGTAASAAPVSGRGTGSVRRRGSGESTRPDASPDASDSEASGAAGRARLPPRQRHPESGWNGSTAWDDDDEFGEDASPTAPAAAAAGPRRKARFRL